MSRAGFRGDRVLWVPSFKRSGFLTVPGSAEAGRRWPVLRSPSGAACQTQPGSNRQVSNAIHTIAIIRAKHQPETRAYLDRRIAEGKTKREALRALRRHISRDVFKRLNEIALTS